MARTIPKSMAGILEDLELMRELYVNVSRIRELAQKYNIKTAPYIIASRLKEEGWLLPTSQRGVWEFVPASSAGVFSQNDPLGPVKAYRSANPDTECYLCLQSAAWALGLADRLPEHSQLAFPHIPRRGISEDIVTYVYQPSIGPVTAKGIPCLAPESIIVHIAARPAVIGAWESVLEWLPDVVYESKIDVLLEELRDRNDSVKKRTGYLLQGMYPSASEEIRKLITTDSKIRFGPRSGALRNDEKWNVSDTVLPVDPKKLERVR